VDLSLVPQYVVNALTLGSFYALLAIGYTMVYGIVKMINIAHGDLHMLGAFVGFGTVTLVSSLVLPREVVLALAVITAMLACALIGMFIEAAIYKPIRTDRRTSTTAGPLIAAIGVSYVLQNGAAVVWGPNRNAFPSLLPRDAIPILGASVSITQLVVVILAPVTMLVLFAIVQRTRLGMAMRASSADPPVARLQGIDVERVILITFAIAGAMAGLAGVLVAAYYGSFYPFMGLVAGFKAFTGAVLGGIGSVHGAMLGGYLLGGLEVLGTAIFPSEWKDVFAFIVLILLLTVRPTGIVRDVSAAGA
jgi:branched-chain amino acid transport system permease protein